MNKLLSRAVFLSILSSFACSRDEKLAEENATPQKATQTSENGWRLRSGWLTPSSVYGELSNLPHSVNILPPFEHDELIVELPRRVARRVYLTNIVIALGSSQGLGPMLAANLIGSQREDLLPDSSSLFPEKELLEFYKADRYIKAAAHLQALGPPRAMGTLLELAKGKGKGNCNVFVLCRMLFVQKSGHPFPRPGRGAAEFPGNTTYEDWPLDPIELVNGVPFYISRNESLAGSPETAENYLKACIVNCDWNNYRFEPKTQQQKAEALSKLFGLPSWKRPLDRYEKQTFALQLEDDIGKGRGKGE
jgi:hypothetical protein